MIFTINTTKVTDPIVDATSSIAKATSNVATNVAVTVKDSTVEAAGWLKNKLTRVKLDPQTEEALGELAEVLKYNNDTVTLKECVERLKKVTSELQEMINNR